MSEKQLWKWLRSNALPRGHYSRIESETSAGFPDINYCIQGIEGNLELKVSRSPNGEYPFKRGGLRRTQISWMEDRTERRGRVTLLVQVGARLYGFHIRDKKSLGLSLNYMTLDQIKRAADFRIPRTKSKHTQDQLLYLLTM